MARIRGNNKNNRLTGTIDPDTIFGLGGNQYIFAILENMAVDIGVLFKWGDDPLVRIST